MTADLPTETIGGFTVLESLGRGAAAQVFRVRRTDGHEPVDFALKLLTREGDEPGDGAAVLRREAALLAGVAHPGLVTIHEVGEHAGRPYLVMDLVAGHPLTAVLAGCAMAPARVIELARDLVGPLAAVHRRGLMHRDLTPNNIMIQPDGRARLIDFGLADRLSDTVTSTAAGTLLYAAPEQTGMLRRAPDHRSDLYSLGVVLFECLAGRPPFVADDVADLLRMHAGAAPPDLRDLVPDVPAELAELIGTLLAKDPDDRYDDAVQVAEDLDRIEALLAPAGRTGHGASPFVPSRVAPRWAYAARRRNALVGRSAELGVLQAHWNTAREGAGGLRHLAGPAGVGKSALAAELALGVEATGALVLSGRSTPDDAAPLAPLRDALSGHLAWVERLPPARRDDANARLRRAAGPDAGLIAGLVAALPRVLGSGPAAGPDPSGGGPSGGPTTADADGFDGAVVGLLTGLAEEYGGLLLVLDDAQWLDPVSARVLARLAADLDDTPIMVLLLSRTDSGSAPIVRGDPGLGRPDLVLEPLPVPSVADLVRAALPGADPGPRLTELITARCSGNPLVAHEYLRAMVDAGLLRPHWGEWSLDEAGLQALDLPDDAVGLVLARLRQLPPRTVDLLVTAAVVGARFRCGLVAAVHGLDPADVLAATGEAAGHGLVEPCGDETFSFVHEAVRGALLDGLDPAGTARRHLLVAAAVEAEPAPPEGSPAERVFAVAHHYLAAGIDRAPATAYDTFRQAGVLALESFAPARAVAFLGAARDLATASNDPTAGPDDEGPGGPRLQLLLGTALHQDNAFAAAETILEEALAEACAPSLRAEILAELADLQRATWRLDQAMDTVARGLAELGSPLPRSRPVLLITSLWLYLLGRVTESAGSWAPIVRGPALERYRMICQLYGVAGYAALLNGSMDLMALYALRLPYWANRIGSGPERLGGQVNLAYLAMALGRQRAAERRFAAMRNDPSWSVPTVRALLLDVQGSSYYFLDRDDGRRFADVLLGQSRWLETPVYRDGCDALALHEANAGRTRRSSQWAERGRRRVTAAGGAAASPVHRLTNVMVEAMRGRPAQAAAMLRDIETTLPEPCPVGIAVVHRLAAVIVLREQDETGEPFDRAVEAFEALGLGPRALIRLHRIVYFHIAAGRLAQARRASGTERPIRLAQAAAALKQLRRFRRDPDLRALERVARADLLLQQGDVRKALRALAELDDADRHDVPLAAYEGARVRARTLAILGLADESDRQARFALSVADDESWPHRAAWLVSEFGTAAVRRSRAGTGSTSHQTAGAGAVTTVSAKGFSVTGTSHAGDAQVQLQRQRLQALQQVSLAASRVVDPAVLARISLDQTIRILSAERAYLFLTDDREQLVPFLGRSAAGDDIAELTGYSASLVERVHGDGRPLVVTGTEEGAALGAQSVVLHGLRSIVIAPLRLENRRLGVVYLDSQVAKGIFTPDDVDILTALTTHIATSLETARAAQLAISVQTARRERDLAERLREASQALAGATSPALVLTGLIDWTGRLTHSDAGWVVVRGPDGDRLHHASGPPAGEPIVADAELDALLAADRPVVGSPDAVPRALRADLGPRPWLALPLRSGELRTGVLVLRAAPADDVTGAAPSALADDVDVASALVAQAATAYDRATLFARVQALAVADELTGIANRRHLFDVARRDVETCLRAARPLAAAMMDIDHFKAVNDTYGHPTGDDVIQTVAQRLAAELRSTDLLGRYGGEEFAAVMLDVDEALDVAERIRAAVADTPVPTRSGPLKITVSVGMAQLAAGDDLDSLLARADQALYRAKQQGRNRVCVAETTKTTGTAGTAEAPPTPARPNYVI